MELDFFMEKVRGNLIFFIKYDLIINSIFFLFRKFLINLKIVKYTLNNPFIDRKITLQYRTTDYLFFISDACIPVSFFVIILVV